MRKILYVIPAAAPTIIFTEVASRAGRAVVNEAGGDGEQTERTFRAILGAGSVAGKLTD